MEAIIAATIAAVPASLTGLAAWRTSRQVNKAVQGNGLGDVSKVSDKTYRLLEDLARDVRTHGDWIDRHRLEHLERRN